MTHCTAGVSIREVRCDALAAALVHCRSDTLATFAVYESALAGAGWAVPPRAEINPPLWELGHIGWFQAYWVARNPQRVRGSAADPDVVRTPCLPADGDAWYDSSRVPHAARASLRLPDADTTRWHLRSQLDRTLALLRDAAADDDALYFWRLVLLHEDMHHEAALYTAQSLGLPISDRRWQPAPATSARAPLAFDVGHWRQGNDAPGLAFDNELGAHEVSVAACRIDSRVVTWAEYLPFIEAGGYAEPRYLRRDGSTWQKQWQEQRWGHWQPLDLALPACHLSAHEAEAWCAWAGRRLPTEAEWERAAVERPDSFAWGSVWEWTASHFMPYPGFTAHPYRDYSAPWFGSRRVLRGASFGTQPRLQHPRYRNFFPPERTDIFAGFRSCAR